jgi:hypothetical protein
MKQKPYSRFGDERRPRAARPVKRPSRPSGLTQDRVPYRTQRSVTIPKTTNSTSRTKADKAALLNYEPSIWKLCTD